VDDVLQEVFLVAWRRWDMLDAAESRCWLFVVAIRQASNYRQLARHRVECSMHEPPEAVAPGFEPESIDASRRLGRLLRRLRPKAREVFVRSALLGESIQEIASALGQKPKTVYARLKAARAQLARLAG
jgi:RNA polymerase sigma-70 factor (ECF subfamily)